MKVVRVWKVNALLTKRFCELMREKGLRQDSPATILNSLAGYNYFYETDESFGDVTEFGAENICRSNSVEMKEYALCMAV